VIANTAGMYGDLQGIRVHETTKLRTRYYEDERTRYYEDERTRYYEGFHRRGAGEEEETEAAPVTPDAAASPNNGVDEDVESDDTSPSRAAA
jgi:hypothetical protein